MAAVVVSGIKAHEIKLMEKNSSQCFVSCAEIIADSMLARFFMDGGRTNFAVSRHLLCLSFLILNMPFVDNIIPFVIELFLRGPF